MIEIRSDGNVLKVSVWRRQEAITFSHNLGIQILADASAIQLNRWMRDELEFIRRSCYDAGWKDRGAKRKKQTFHDMGWYRGV